MFLSSACRSYNKICPPTVVLLLHVYKILFYLKFILGFVVVSVSNQSIIDPTFAHDLNNVILEHEWRNACVIQV